MRRTYWHLRDPEISPIQAARDVFRVRDVDLSRVLIEDRRWECGFAEPTEDPLHLSVLLSDSPQVAFLERYRALGDEVLAWGQFEHTPYFQHALLYARHMGGYFRHMAPDGIREQARYFITLYERMRTEDRRELPARADSKHSRRGSLAMGHHTLTPGIVQIVDGHHRLAISWVLGKRHERMIVRPARPTELQRLVLAAAGAPSGALPRQLQQPLEAPEFDASWPVAGRCEGQLAAMLAFLHAHGHKLEGATALDVGCRYGWFVRALAREGAEAVGIDREASGLKIARSVYGVRRNQLVAGDAEPFLDGSSRRFDVVLCLDVSAVARPERLAQLLQGLDRVTKSVLFLHGEIAREVVTTHTTFTDVVALGAGGAGGALLACVRL